MEHEKDETFSNLLKFSPTFSCKFWVLILILFLLENMIGKGGHAEVYKGVLPDGETVAIKKLTRHAKEKEERVSDFLSELGIIAHVNHPNAARLRGFSCDRGLHFVLEYSPHGSLASLLFGTLSM